MREPRPIEPMETLGALMLTAGIVMLVWLLLPVLVEIMLYLMGAVAIYYLYRQHIRPGIEVRKFRKEVERGTRHPY